MEEFPGGFKQAHIETDDGQGVRVFNDNEVLYCTSNERSEQWMWMDVPEYLENKC